jgi:hypothetical protein
LKDTTTTGRLQRLLPGATSASRFGGAFEEGARVAGAVAGHRADDLPAYLVIVIVGHVLVPVILWIEVDYAPSLAFQLGIYLPITALASIALLQPVKGAVVALQMKLEGAIASTNCLV